MKSVLALLGIFSFSLISCSGFEMDSALVEGVTSNSSLAEVQLKITQTSSTILIESDLTVTGATNVTYTWYKSTSITAGQDVSKYSLVGFSGAVLDAAALGTSFNGLILLKVALQTSSRSYEIFSSPLRLDLTSPQITATPTRAPTSTPRATTTPTPPATATPTTAPTPPPIVGAPAWTAGINAGSWKAISKLKSDGTLSTIYSVRPNPPAEGAYNPLAYSGGALSKYYSTHGGLIVFGGGHKDYYGNEIYVFDLSSAEWKRLSNPSPLISTEKLSVTHNFCTPGLESEFSEWADGTPLSSHTYDSSDFHEGTNSFIFGSATCDNQGNGQSIGFMFSFDTLSWRRSQKFVGVSRHGSSAYDATRDIMWFLSGESSSGSKFGFFSFDPKYENSDGTYGKVTNYLYGAGILDRSAAYDPLHDLFVYTDFRDSTKIYAIDLHNLVVGGTLTGSRVLLNPSGVIPFQHKGAGGWEWSNKRQAFLYWHGGSDVWEFKNKNGGALTSEWVWTKLTSGQNAVIPYTSDRTYSRFRIINYGAEEFAVTINGLRESVYAFRIP